MRKAFAKVLVEIAATDSRIVLMTGDLGFMVLEEFADKYPDRFFNVGVAEANMVGLATGLASTGYIPFIYSIATFASMRGFEQIRNGPILHQLPVRIVGTGGGFEYGHGGFTHFALEDLGITRTQPGLTVIAPADRLQAANALRKTYDLHGPVYYRIGKGEDYLIPRLDGRFTLGNIDCVREGTDVLLVTIGSIAEEVYFAAEALAESGIETTIAIVSSLHPAPTLGLMELLNRFRLAVTVEEHYVEGGLGSLVAEVIAENENTCRLIRCGVRHSTINTTGSQAFMREVNGLSSDGIKRMVIAAFQEIANEPIT